MTNNTSTPSLPLTLADLNALLPAAPADTAVARALEAIACIDKAVRSQVAELAHLEQIDQRDVAALVEAAGTGDMTKALGTIKQSNRPVVELRLDMLRRARLVLVQQHDEAERSDPAYVAWQQRCQERTDEWQRLATIDDESARFAALIAFTSSLVDRPI
jgi:hypothetical protein